MCLFYCSKIRSATHMAATRCISACRQGPNDLLKFELSIRMRTKGFDYGMNVNLIQKLLICRGFPHTTSSSLQRMVPKTENIRWAAALWVKMTCWCQRMAKLLRADRKATVREITHHIQGNHTGLGTCRMALCLSFSCSSRMVGSGFGGGGTRASLHGNAANKCAAAAWSCHVKVEPASKVSSTFSSLCM